MSKCYCGRASDKSITVNSKSLDLLDMYDQLQADKGFNIASECEAQFVSLDVPPGKRGAAQLSIAACNKTKRIANQRIPGMCSRTDISRPRPRPDESGALARLRLLRLKHVPMFTKND